MNYIRINGENFYNMVINASNKLEEQSEYVNSLNVFPVPDGDTGTNMSMTFKAAVKEIEALKGASLGEISKKLAKGALMGARGNSGVILSQILRGISKGLDNKIEADAKEFANALAEGAKSAYKAVMRPTEGTILTIIRAASEAAAESNAKDITGLMDQVCKHSKVMLDKTPEMLPALKKAKVVDSGGMGLLIILQGMYEALDKNLEVTIKDFKPASTGVSAANNLEDHDIKFGYCTEFIIVGDSSKANEFKADIEHFGDSMIVVGYEDVIKVHIHTNDPGAVLSKAVKLGELSKIKIDNMREEHKHLLVEKEYEASNEDSVAVEEEVEEKKKYAFISVAMGEGIKNIFKDLGVDHVIEGGQTMNPSTQDILECIEKLNAEHIFVFPNNKNIIMAANQAAEISEKHIVVIPTKTIPQGITAITMFNPEAEVEENIEELTSSVDFVKSASVTYAVRDTEMDGIEIKEGNILGLIESKIKNVGSDVYEVTEELLNQMIDNDSELITLFYGKECDKKQVEAFVSAIEKKYSDLDVQCYAGEQPLYYFLISVE
jgi:DAK2 domain fusion protein YloV